MGIGFERTLVRLLRGLVLSLASTTALAAHSLHHLGTAQRVAASIALWSLWGIALLCVLVPSSTTLTAVRLAISTHAATLAVIVVATPSHVTPGVIAAGALSLLSVVIAFTGEVGIHFIQSSAYGDERRYPLMTPPSHALVLVMAWSIWFVCAALGTILLLNGTLVGAVPAALALGGCAFLPTRFHRYARRWLVMVPAGLVVHDHVLLTETAMFSHRAVTAIEAWLAPSPTDEPLDLSGGLRRTGVTLRLAETETVILAPTPRERGGRAVHVRSIHLCPTRVGRTLTELRSRH